MENKQLTNKELNKKIDETIDNVIQTSRDNSRSLVDLIYEKAMQTLGDLFDKNIDQFKQKIKERLSINEKSKT